jgi:hypothetical protein
VLSAVTIAVEFFLAAALLVRPLWPIGMAIAFAFVVYLEFILRPGLFAWDVLAALLVFAPAGDRSWTAAYDPERPSGRRTRAILSPLDWLRRLRWVPAPAMATKESRCEAGGDAARRGFHLVSPRGRPYQGFDALRLLPIILPGPVVVVMTLGYFGGRFLADRGYGRWDDVPFLALGCLLALWVPGVARGRPTEERIPREHSGREQP